MYQTWKEILLYDNLLQFCALCACTILVAYLLTEIIGCGSCCPGFKGVYQQKATRFMYGYSVENGPHTWKDKYPASRGKKQSPVCILTREAVLVKSAPPLTWTNYNCAPLRMTLFNNGTTVALQGLWAERPPTLQGGPVQAPYQFQAALFRWGLSDAEGSEHILDYMGFPLELQAMHTAPATTAAAAAASSARAAPATLCLSYLFEITEVDNPYLDHVVLSLPQVAQPGSAVELMPFPMVWLCPAFATGFFCYDGSLTFPPCTENVCWILRPVTIGISARQVDAFRQAMGWNGVLRSNLRPVQPLNCRPIFFYKTPEDGEGAGDSSEQ